MSEGQVWGVCAIHGTDMIVSPAGEEYCPACVDDEERNEGEPEDYVIDDWDEADG